MVLHREGRGHPPATVPPAPWECAPRAPLQTPREPNSSDARRPDKQTCPQQEGALASSARPHPEPASCPSTSKMGTVRSLLYLLGPSLQLLPLLHAELPHAGQQVMRGDEDPGAQEKREDVRPLKTEMERVTRESGPVWPQGWRGRPCPLAQPPPRPSISCVAQLTLNALPPPHCSPILPTRHGTDETPLGSGSPPPPLTSSVPSALTLLGGSPTHCPTPRWELNPKVHVGGTLRAWEGLLPRPQCSLGQAPSLLCARCSVASEAGPGWWGVHGGLICGAGQALLGPRIPHQKLLQAPVTSQLRASPPPATPGPPSPTSMSLSPGLVQAAGCSWSERQQDPGLSEAFV